MTCQGSEEFQIQKGVPVITTLSNTLKKYAEGRIILVFLALMLLFGMFIVPTIQSKLEVSSGGAGPIDFVILHTRKSIFDD